MQSTLSRSPVSLRYLRHQVVGSKRISTAGFLSRLHRLAADSVSSVTRHIPARLSLNLNRPMNLQEIQAIEEACRLGRLKLTPEEKRKLDMLRNIIEFFHMAFPDSDPYHQQRYSLNL